MDVEKYWFYLVLAAIYGLSRLLKKDPAKPANAPRKVTPPPKASEPRRMHTPSTTAAPVSRPAPPKQQPRPMTFEDLMREIMEAKTTPPKQEPVVDYDDDIEEEERSLEDVSYDSRRDSEAVATYERAKAEAFSRSSLEETMSIEDTDVSFGKFSEFERTVETNPAEEYVKAFADMDSVRRAVVMSEILKPKF